MKKVRIKRNKRLKGFTLIEMMFVIVIIGILASLMTTGAFRAIREAREEKAKVAISAIEAALEMYKLDVGSYPAGDGSGNSFKSHLQNDDGAVGWSGPYMSFNSTNNSINDPWDNAYRYKCPGTSHGSTENPLDIWSCGNDEVDNSGGGDDLNTWD